MSQSAGGRLTTHVLDLASGLPAAGLSVSLFRIAGEARTLLKTVTTNADGDRVTIDRDGVEVDVGDEDTRVKADIDP